MCTAYSARHQAERTANSRLQKVLVAVTGLALTTSAVARSFARKASVITLLAVAEAEAEDDLDDDADGCHCPRDAGLWRSHSELAWARRLQRGVPDDNDSK